MATLISYPSASVRNEAPTAMRTQIAVPDDVLRELAETIRVEAECSNEWRVRISAEAERDGKVFAIEFDGCCYFQPINCPDFVGRELSALLPNWVELRTYDEVGDERTNDFTIDRLTKYLP